MCFEDSLQWLHDATISAYLYRLEQSKGTFSSLDYGNAVNVHDKLEKDIEKGVILRTSTYLGHVVNLDLPSSGSGHWVAVLIDRKERTIEYSDSFGAKPPKHVRELLDKIEIWVKDAERKWALARGWQPPEEGFRHLETSTRHQHGGWACGLYALRYITERVVNRKSFEQLNASPRVPDRDMVDFRSREFPGTTETHWSQRACCSADFLFS